MQIKEILSRYFGYETFRAGQEEIIRHLLAGQHALVIMPTGMGKSLCYQVPALHLGQQSNDVNPQRTVVISPLIALMKDQVDALVQKDIAATYVNSSLSASERQKRYEGIEQGRYDLIYVTPERFQKPDFVKAIRRNPIGLLAVDEAHCISQWGHDFRPDYTRLGELRSLLGDPTTVALTATATPEVQADIVNQLRVPSAQLFHHGIERPNLDLMVQEVWGDDEKLAAIQETNSRFAGSGIVYFTLIRTLLRFSQRLREEDVHHVIYHGELERARRRKIQEWFMSDDHLVLATNAFGMGIDKESIRFVMHAELPSSMEAYYQEIGRAGRDGAPAECRLLYDQNDLETQLEFLRWSNPDAAFYRRLYDLLSHELEQANAFGLEWIREKLHHKRRHDRRLETALGMLQRYGVIEGSFDDSNLSVTGPLPAELSEPSQLADKLRRDQQKLYNLVRYVQYAGDRQAFLRQYFRPPDQSPATATHT